MLTYPNQLYPIATVRVILVPPLIQHLSFIICFYNLIFGGVAPLLALSLAQHFVPPPLSRMAVVLTKSEGNKHSDIC